MYTEKYWQEKVRLTMEEYNPKRYRELKKNGQLKEETDSIARTAQTRFNDMHEWLKENRTAQKTWETPNPTAAQIATNNHENESMAREEAEQVIMNLVQPEEDEEKEPWEIDPEDDLPDDYMDMMYEVIQQWMADLDQGN